MSDEPAKAIASRLVCGGLLDPSQRSVDANTSIISDKLASLTTELAASRAREAKLREALEKIERWHGEFPSAPDYKDGQGRMHRQSYGAANGSNGERDYMRQLARAALSASEDATA